MEKKKKEKVKEKSQPKSLLRYTGIATQMASIILIGVFGGIKLDEYLALETPIFTLVFSLLSVVFSMYIVIKDLSK